ncbi:MAG: M20/M25/M40 family metallo-hydrolase, partial [Brevundimonas sp.]
MSTSSGAVVVALARRAERTIVQTLREHGATAVDRAIPLSVGRRGGSSALGRLLRTASVRESGDRYWLDERAYEAMRDGRRVRAIFALIVVATIVVALIALGATRAEAQTSAIRPDQAAFRDLYEELVETNTTLSEGSCTLASERMAARLLAAGYSAADVRVLAPADRPKDGNLAAVLRGSDPAAPPLLLLAHIDVVEANRADWTRDPFTLIEEDGYFYARGATDDKAQASVWVDTLIRMKAQGFAPRRDIKIALTCGEETADTWNGVEWLLREHPDALQAGFALNEGAGGQLDVEGNRIALNVQAGEKLYQDYQLELTNPGGHSARPRKDNAIAAMSRSLAALGDHDFALELNPVTRAYFAAVAESSPQYADDLRALTASDTPDAAAAARLSAA